MSDLPEFSRPNNKVGSWVTVHRIGLSGVWERAGDTAKTQRRENFMDSN